jgi:hypothetical protein
MVRGETMVNQKPTPQTEHDWTIRALNIHGAFFERWCASTAVSAEGWSVLDTRVPVEYPSTSPRARAAESEIDVVAQTLRNACHIELLIEAKKNTPEFVRWVFFRPTRQRALGVRLISSEVNTGGLNPRWNLRVRRGGVLDERDRGRRGT